MGIIFIPSIVFSAEGLVPCDVGCDLPQFIKLIQNVINFLMFDVAAPLAALMFAWAGVKMFTAGGSPEKINSAKEIFQWVIVGILIALAGWLIVSTILGTFLGSDISGFVKQNFLDF